MDRDYLIGEMKPMATPVLITVMVLPFVIGASVL